jgi:hypothetical protein
VECTCTRVKRQNSTPLSGQSGGVVAVMTQETEQLLHELMIELLHELRAARRERERDEDEYRRDDILSRQHGYPPPRRRRRWP